MDWLDKVKACNPFDPENRKRVYMEVPIPDAELALRVMERSWRQLELDRLIEIAKLLQEIIDDGTGSPDGKKRVWPIRAAHWREAKRLLSDEWEPLTWRGGEALLERVAQTQRDEGGVSDE